MKNNSRDNLIDFIKFIASILVITIHTGVFSNTATFVWQFDVFARMAVPFFIICSGYYLAKQCEVYDGRIVSNIHTKKIFVKFIKKIGLLYTAWSLVYLLVSIPEWIKIGWFGKAAFIDWAVAFFVRGSYYHLWYLLFVVYAVIFLYVVVRRIKIKYFAVLSVLLYVIEVLQYGYRIFLPEKIQNVLMVFDKLPCLSSITRVLPFLLLGICISHEKEKNGKFYKLGLIASLLVVIIERNFLLYNNQEDVSYILAMLPVSYFLFQLVVQYKKILATRDLKILSEISTLIYVVHPIFINLIRTIISDKFMVFMLVAILSIIFSVLYLRISVIFSKK